MDSFKKIVAKYKKIVIKYRVILLCIVYFVATIVAYNIAIKEENATIVSKMKQYGAISAYVAAIMAFLLFFIAIPNDSRTKIVNLIMVAS